MKFRLIIDVPEETVANYQKESKPYIDLLNNYKNLEDFIKSIIEDQTTWEVEDLSLLDKKEFNKLLDFFKSN